jgi:CRISPR-associated protein Cmx8
MGRARGNAAPLTSITVKYDLFDLPTAQHKAGLAGLLLQLDSMKARNLPEDAIPQVAGQTPTTAAIHFTEKSVQALFDDLYDATAEEVVVKSKWQGAKPKREEEVEETDEEGKKTTSKRYVYDQVQPSGHFLRQHLPEMDRGKDWHKLWRDMLWNIPRGIPNTRIPFELRAGWDAKKHKGGGPKRSCKEGKEVWDNLLRVERAKAKGEFYTAKVASSLWLGAQAANAEAIPFQGRAEQTLLLHFWQLTVLVFAPQQIDADGQGQFVGYVLAIPEVADLENFLADYPIMLSELGTAVRGFRPAEAVIDLPAQGALTFLEHLARLSQRAATKSRVAYSVDSIEFVHLAKFGNNTKSMAAGRIAPRPELVEAYRAIVGQPGRPSPFRNPLFRRGLMLALLNDQPWHQPFAGLLSNYPWPHFLRSTKTPRTMPLFASDAAAKFRADSDYHRQWKEMLKVTTQDDSQAARRPTEQLPLLIHRLVRNYVKQKTEEKSGIKWEDFKGKKIKDPETGRERTDVPKAYSEAREKIASGTFLEMRSRREQDFVDHFTATFCSVRQYLPEAEFQVVAEALLKEPDDVKTLTLLALSANS